MIEVILREDVHSLGKAGDLVRVKPGYARNFLLPKGFAYQATDGNKKRIEAETKSRNARLAADKVDAEALAGVLGQVPITLARKVGEGDRLFGSITAQDIADALAAAGHEVDKRKIDLESPVKSIGEHVVPIKLHPEVVADIHLTVVPE
ncbi:MAG: 50S ribosomal protein L9 [Gemmatimonadales bacterium]|jgi:large subunit ribosomal protein L9